MTSNQHPLIVLILEPSDFSSEAISMLQNADCTIYYGINSISPDEISYVSILFSRLSYQLDAFFLSQFSNLKYIVSPATGVAHIDMPYLEKNNIKLLSLVGHTAFLRKITPTIEITIWLILSLLRNALLASYSYKHQVNPSSWDRDFYIGRDLYEANIGIVGLGRIGSHVASVLTALGSNVSYYDPYVVSDSYDQLFTF